MSRKIIGICSVEDCERPIDALGWCSVHYERMYRRGRLHKVNSNKRSHPLYAIWWERKRSGILCEEWQDLFVFARDVGEKRKNHFLVRLRGDEPLGPQNFTWQEHLKRKPGEPRKEWHARKWASRVANNPSLNRHHELKKRFGLTIADYEKQLAEQGGVCAICRKEETSFDPKIGSRRRLAVDHCHKTNRIRGLLCFRCNGTLGKIEESPALLDAIRAYIEKYNPHPQQSLE